MALALVAGLALFLVLSVAWIGLYRVVNPPVTGLMLLRHGFDRPGTAWREWRPLEELGTHLPVAVLAAEDQRFAAHWGIDVTELRHALADALEGRGLRGASTISQQTAKNAFLWPGRSMLRKGIEAYFTVVMEALWPKRRVLEVYLNIIEMGDGVYGAERAAQHYFGKPAKALSREEAALLAAVLPNPRVLSPARPSADVRGKQRWILQQMENLGGARLLERIK